jgi:hypothetical protein
MKLGMYVTSSYNSVSFSSGNIDSTGNVSAVAIPIILYKRQQQKYLWHHKVSAAVI